MRNIIIIPKQMPATIKPNSTALDFSRMMTVIAKTNIKTANPFSNLLSKMEKAVSKTCSQRWKRP